MKRKNSCAKVLLVSLVLLACAGCGPSAQERQAEALLARAQELALVGGGYQTRAAAHAQAEKIFKEIIANYPSTDAAKAAARGVASMAAIHEEDKKVAGQELLDTYRSATGRMLDSVKPPR